MQKRPPPTGLIFQRHAYHWEQLPADRKARLDTEAQAETCKRTTARRDEIHELSERIAVLSSEAAVDGDGASACSMRACAFRERDVGALADSLNASFARRRTSTTREHASHPRKLSVEEIQSLKSASLIPDKEAKQLPQWVRKVVAHRTFFVDSVFLLEASEQIMWLKFVAGLQNPWTASFLNCLETAQPPHERASSLDLQGLWSARWPNKVVLSFVAGAFVDGTDLPDTETGLVGVFMRARYTAGDTVETECDMIPLSEALAAIELDVGKPTTRTGERSIGKSGQAAGGEEAVPVWMQNYLKKRGVASSSEQVSGEQPVAAVDTEEKDDLEGQGDELFHELEAARETFEGVSSTDYASQYRISLIGETRLLDTRGSVVHAYQGRVKKDTAAEQMCDELGLNKSSRYETSAFGAAAASTMVRAWVHRMAFVLRMYLEHPESEFQRALRSYEPESEYTTCVASLSGRSKARAESILEIALLGLSASASERKLAHMFNAQKYICGCTSLVL
eukprot:6461380-Amphidinium_carterae.1